MPLEIQEIREILEKKPTRNRHELSKAVHHENRIKLHSETAISRHSASAALTEFFELVRNIISDEEKYFSFLTLFQFPVATMPLTDQIYTALEKIFDGRNPVFNYEFTNPETEQDFVKYRNGELRLHRFWRTKGFEAMKTRINSITIVDLPADPTVGRPEPYVYILPLQNTVDLEVNKEDPNQLEWIIFEQDGDRLAVFDDRSYRVFNVEPGTKTKIVGEPIVSNEHQLGYCPARFFWTTPQSYEKPIIKKSPLTGQLGKLDMLLFYEISNEHLQTYGRWPIYSVFKTDCDFEDPVTGHFCDSGFLRTRENLYVLDELRKPKHCPVCVRRRLEGPGSVVEIDPPSRMNDKADLRNPVQITGPEVEGLNYNNSDLDRRRHDIYSAVTGYQGMPINDQAVNERQVRAMFESMEAALKNPQENFEAIMTWTDATLAKLRYGGAFQGGSISLGTDHYILATSEILLLYQESRKAGISVTTLDMLEDKYYETEYKNNPERLKRQRMISNIDPFRHRTVGEVTAMHMANQIRYEDFMVKVNLSSLIMRFERENSVITEFGQNLDYDVRIRAIREELAKYTMETKPEPLPAPEPEPAPFT